MMALPVALLPCCLQVYNSKKELKAGQDFKLVTDYEQKVGFHSSYSHAALRYQFFKGNPGDVLVE